MTYLVNTTSSRLCHSDCLSLTKLKHISKEVEWLISMHMIFFMPHVYVNFMRDKKYKNP
jgi:hypothetical protein